MICTDVYLGAWLLNEGATLKRVQVSRSNGKTTAVFELDGIAIDENAQRFYNEAAIVNLAEYRRHLEELKDHLFDALRHNDAERRTDDEDARRPRRPRRHAHR